MCHQTIQHKFVVQTNESPFFAFPAVFPVCGTCVRDMRIPSPFSLANEESSAQFIRRSFSAHAIPINFLAGEIFTCRTTFRCWQTETSAM